MWTEMRRSFEMLELIHGLAHLMSAADLVAGGLDDSVLVALRVV